jgi:hypothetical protein
MHLKILKRKGHVVLIENGKRIMNGSPEGMQRAATWCFRPDLGETREQVLHIPRIIVLLDKLTVLGYSRYFQYLIEPQTPLPYPEYPARYSGPDKSSLFL